MIFPKFSKFNSKYENQARLYLSISSYPDLVPLSNSNNVCEIELENNEDFTLLQKQDVTRRQSDCKAAISAALSSSPQQLSVLLYRVWT